MEQPKTEQNVQAAQKAATPDTTIQHQVDQIESRLSYIENFVQQLGSKIKELDTSFQKSNPGMQVRMLRVILDRTKSIPDFVAFLDQLPHFTEAINGLDPRFGKKLTDMKKMIAEGCPEQHEFYYMKKVEETTSVEVKNIYNIHSKKVAVEEVERIVKFFNDFYTNIKKNYPREEVLKDLEQYKKTHLTHIQNYFKELDSFKDTLYSLFLDDDIGFIQKKEIPKQADSRIQNIINHMIRFQIFDDDDYKRFKAKGIPTYNNVNIEDLMTRLKAFGEALATRFGDPEHAKVFLGQLKIPMDKYSVAMTVIQIIDSIGQLSKMTEDEKKALLELNRIAKSNHKLMFEIVHKFRINLCELVEKQAIKLEKKHAKELNQLRKFEKELFTRLESYWAAVTNLKQFSDLESEVVEHKNQLLAYDRQSWANIDQSTEQLIASKERPELNDVAAKHSEYLKQMKQHLDQINMTKRLFDLDTHMVELATQEEDLRLTLQRELESIHKRAVDEDAWLKKHRLETQPKN